MRVSRLQLNNGDNVLSECVNNLKLAMKKKNAENVESIDALNDLLSNLRNKKDGK